MGGDSVSVIITRTKTTDYNISAVKFPFLEYTERLREIRSRFRYKGSACFDCRKPFRIGDVTGLIFTSRGNRFVCKECALKIEQDLKEAGEL